MKTKVITIQKKKIDILALTQAAAALKSGGVVVFPTDTVYGLAANAFNAGARKKIYALKGRSYKKPLIVMAHRAGLIARLAHISKDAERLINKFWPGPLTLVLPVTDIGALVMGGRKDLGARIPADRVAQKLLSLCDFPLVTTSANPSSKPSAKTGAEAQRYFKGKVELIIDAGPCRNKRESTVLDVVAHPYCVVREGCIAKEELLGL